MARPRGSIEQRGKNSWRIEIPLGLREDGTYDRYRETFTGTRKEAEKRRTELLYQLDTRRLAPHDGMTYGEYLDRWLKTYAEVYTEPGTHREYARHARLRIIPMLGHVPLSKLSAMHISQFYASLQKPGARRDGKMGALSASTVRRVHAVVHQSLRHAVDWRLIPYNPAADVQLPKTAKPRRRLWNEQQLQIFLGKLKDHPQYALIVTLALTGIRISEALALKWDDVDFEYHTITIDESLKKPGPEPIFGDTKNHQVRKIPMSEELAKVLRSQKTRCMKTKLVMGGDWNPHNLVFPTESGTAMHRGNFQKRVWEPLIEEAELPYINIHGLRHTFGTLFMKGGSDPKLLKEILGHHSVAFTLDQYNHPDDEEKRRAMAQFTRRLKGG